MAPSAPASGDDPNGFAWRPGRTIPWSEISFEQDTGGGPGGQHVNRTATRVTLIWEPGQSSAFSEEERIRLRSKLSHRLNTKGELRLRSAGERSARRNRESVLDLLARLLTDSLAKQRKRRPTKPTQGSKKRRLNDKKRRKDIKKGRQKPRFDG